MMVVDYSTSCYIYIKYRSFDYYYYDDDDDDVLFYIIKLQFGEDFLDYLDTIIEDHLGQQLPLNEEWKNYLNRYELQARDYSLKRFSKGLQIGSQVLNIDYIGYKNRQDNNKKYFKIGKNTNMFNESVTNVTDLF